MLLLTPRQGCLDPFRLLFFCLLTGGTSYSIVSNVFARKEPSSCTRVRVFGGGVYREFHQVSSWYCKSCRRMGLEVCWSGSLPGISRLSCLRHLDIWSWCLPPLRKHSYGYATRGVLRAFTCHISGLVIILFFLRTRPRGCLDASHMTQKGRLRRGGVEDTGRILAKTLCHFLLVGGGDKCW